MTMRGRTGGGLGHAERGARWQGRAACGARVDIMWCVAWCQLKYVGGVNLVPAHLDVLLSLASA